MMIVLDAFLNIFFLMWTTFKVFIEFVTILLLFYVLVFCPRGMWDLSSPARDRTCTPCIGRECLNHWTAREGPKVLDAFDAFSLIIITTTYLADTLLSTLFISRIGF